MTNQLIITDLEKWFGSRRVFAQLNLTLSNGTYLLHGHNGCGKSTLLSIIAGSLDEYTGSVQLNQIELRAKHKSFVDLVSYCPDSLEFFPQVQVREFMAFVSRHRRLRQDTSIQAIADDFHFDCNTKKTLGELSLGNAKKAMLVAALALDCQLWLFDEPLNGLDVEGKQAFVEHLQKLSEKILIIASHRSADYQQVNPTTMAFSSLMEQ
ncbi:ABC transporter ATP-binding protein [Pleionea sp. CnH1-48]|uniref:ABC transporter ATP-binding protein n=1 Tax=Pleionea sp. CnH1-48 TaxID=2954494 RepID=UPI002096A132|nr:ABC transporter ATP-binding protein [Pleionea sp. CnH1-48]MCO7225135.1 ABC transporter ATP-binding protein [Pleionea sp. CnH1-48]